MQPVLFTAVRVVPLPATPRHPDRRPQPTGNNNTFAARLAVQRHQVVFVVKQTHAAGALRCRTRRSG